MKNNINNINSVASNQLNIGNINKQFSRKAYLTESDIEQNSQKIPKLSSKRSSESSKEYNFMSESNIQKTGEGGRARIKQILNKTFNDTFSSNTSSEKNNLKLNKATHTNKITKPFSLNNLSKADSKSSSYNSKLTLISNPNQNNLTTEKNTKLKNKNTKTLKKALMNESQKALEKLTNVPNRNPKAKKAQTIDDISKDILFEIFWQNYDNYDIDVQQRQLESYTAKIEAEREILNQKKAEYYAHKKYFSDCINISLGNLNEKQEILNNDQIEINTIKGDIERITSEYTLYKTKFSEIEEYSFKVMDDSSRLEAEIKKAEESLLNSLNILNENNLQDQKIVQEDFLIIRESLSISPFFRRKIILRGLDNTNLLEEDKINIFVNSQTSDNTKRISLIIPYNIEELEDKEKNISEKIENLKFEEFKIGYDFLSSLYISHPIYDVKKMFADNNQDAVINKHLMNFFSAYFENILNNKNNFVESNNVNKNYFGLYLSEAIETNIFDDNKKSSSNLLLNKNFFICLEKVIKENLNHTNIDITISVLTEEGFIQYKHYKELKLVNIPKFSLEILTRDEQITVNHYSEKSKFQILENIVFKEDEIREAIYRNGHEEELLFTLNPQFYVVSPKFIGFLKEKNLFFENVNNNINNINSSAKKILGFYFKINFPVLGSKNHIGNISNNNKKDKEIKSDIKILYMDINEYKINNQIIRKLIELTNKKIKIDKLYKPELLSNRESRLVELIFRETEIKNTKISSAYLDMTYSIKYFEFEKNYFHNKIINNPNFGLKAKNSKNSPLNFNKNTNKNSNNLNKSNDMPFPNDRKLERSNSFNKSPAENINKILSNNTSLISQNQRNVKKEIRISPNNHSRTNSNNTNNLKSQHIILNKINLNKTSDFSKTDSNVNSNDVISLNRLHNVKRFDKNCLQLNEAGEVAIKNNISKEYFSDTEMIELNFLKNKEKQDLILIDKKEEAFIDQNYSYNNMQENPQSVSQSIANDNLNIKNRIDNELFAFNFNNKTFNEVIKLFN